MVLFRSFLNAYIHGTFLFISLVNGDISIIESKEWDEASAFEYLLHIGGQKSGTTFDKNITIESVDYSSIFVLRATYCVIPCSGTNEV